MSKVDKLLGVLTELVQTELDWWVHVNMYHQLCSYCYVASSHAYVILLVLITWYWRGCVFFELPRSFRFVGTWLSISAV